MSAPHCTHEELIEHVYGVKSASDHLDTCPECIARLRQIVDAREEATRAPEIPEELLAAQRRAIYHRLGSPVHTWHPMRWATSVVAMLAVVLGLTFYRDKQTGHSKDDQFYAEIATFDQNPAPRAVQPIEAMVHDDIEEQ